MIGRSLRISATLVATAIFAMPIYLALVNVFKPSARILSNPISLPNPISLTNLQRVVNRPDHLLSDGLVTSVSVTTVSLVFVTVIASMLSYYIARRDSRFSRVLLPVLLLGLMIPPQVILGPATLVLRAIGLMTTFPGLILYNIGAHLPFAVFVFVAFIRTIPRDIDDAAKIDGAGSWQTFWRVIFPLLRPATSSVLIFVGVGVWNDFLNPWIILGPVNGNTITVGIYRVLGQYEADYGSQFAFMFLALLPIMAFFIVLQRQFVAGLMSGSTKG